MKYSNGILEFSIGKTTYHIACLEEEKTKFSFLAHKFSKRVSSVNLNTKNADEKTLLVLAGMMAEEELSYKERIDEIYSDEDEGLQFSNQDMYNIVSENIENLAEHIENLTEKIKKY